MDQTTAETQSDTLATADVSDQSQPQESFQNLIPEEYREEKSLQNFSNMNDFVKSYLHSQKLVGADKIPIPNKLATDDDWNAVYERLGRPQNPGFCEPTYIRPFLGTFTINPIISFLKTFFQLYFKTPIQNFFS